MFGEARGRASFGRASFGRAGAVPRCEPSSALPSWKRAAGAVSRYEPSSALPSWKLASFGA